MSLPRDVYNWVEAERRKRELTRSELVTRLLREEMHRQALEDRARQYEAAYRELPETDDERELASWANEEFWRIAAEVEAEERTRE